MSSTAIKTAPDAFPLKLEDARIGVVGLEPPDMGFSKGFAGIGVIA